MCRLAHPFFIPLTCHSLCTSLFNKNITFRNSFKCALGRVGARFIRKLELANKSSPYVTPTSSSALTPKYFGEV